MKIILNNLAVEYRDEGNGPVVLLLHGWKDDLHTYNELIPALGSGFRTVRLDFPGFGGSESPKHAWSTRDYARFVADFCSKLGIRPDVIVGHSFGGRVLLRGLTDGLFTLQKVILIASAGLAKYKTFHAHFFLFAAKIGKVILFFLPKRLKQHFRRRLYGAAGSGDYMNIHNGVLKETFIKAIREDLSGCACAVSIPTLLIWGNRDVTTPVWEGERLHNLISGSRLEVIPGAGHFVHQEKATEVAKLIRMFLV